jgi:hypothetical protein
MYYPGNNWVEGGNLFQQWRHDEDVDIYSSARIDTDGKYSPIYGWYEVSMQVGQFLMHSNKKVKCIPFFKM